jgi:hypothetical protein
MNFTTNTLPNIGKRINWQLVTLAGGLALAVSAAAGLGAFEKDSAAPAQPAASIGQTATISEATAPRPVMYVVESYEQEAAASATMEAEKIVAVMEGHEAPPQQTLFLVVSTPEDEQALNVTLMEQLLLAEPALEVVDLRN